MTRCLRISRAWTGVLLLGAAVWSGSVLLADPVLAQNQTFRTTGGGLNVGRFIFFPSISLDYMKDSNVLYRSDDLPADGNIDSGIFFARPRILADMPLGRSRIRWIYAPVYRNYADESIQLPRRLTHNFDLDSTFHIGPSLRLSVREHYVRGVVELQEVDKGGELTFGLAPFTSHQPSLLVDVDLGSRHGVSLLPRYTEVRFDRGSSGAAAFLSYETKVLEGRYNYRLGPSETLYAYYSYGHTDQRRGQIFFSDLVLTSESFGLGLMRALSPDLTTEMSVGYRTVTFAGGEASDFAGPVCDGRATFQLSAGAGLSLVAGRQPYQSFFLNNSYYIDNEVTLRFVQQIGPKTSLEISGTILTNAYADGLDIGVKPQTEATEDCDGDGQVDGSDCNGNRLIDALESTFCDPPGTCPSLGVRRRDKVTRFQIGAGFRIAPTARLSVGYNEERRGSNIDQVGPGGFYDPFDLRVRRFFFRIEAGWM